MLELQTSRNSVSWASQGSRLVPGGPGTETIFNCY